ncbi:2-hydroxyacyl-CoA dehydratase [Candidatus Fermentibacterales bacterium]|nr:2-hydroxyacyl-CoA dehydratase [Candidatus Fermentibacterales bacterium]
MALPRLDEPQLRQMWTELGVDLDLHDRLLAASHRSHARTHDWQGGRPDTIRLFDEAAFDSHGQRVAEILEHRRAGGKSIGTFCIYVPDEIALAAGVLPIPLCGGSGWSVDYADKMLPRDICPLVRSTFGMALSKTCPYKTLKDFAVGETTCDAKKKTWDLFGFRVMEVPQKKQDVDRELWLEEVRGFREQLEELSGQRVTKERLRDSIKLVNRRRNLLREVNELRKLDEPPISGIDALLVSQAALSMDLERFNSCGQALLDELKKRAGMGVSAYPDNGGTRVLLAGSPSPMGHAKIHYVTESSGMRIVADESCTGIRYYRDTVPEDLETVGEMISAVADRYFRIDCACFSPNSERLENLKALVSDFRAGAVIHNILQYCHGYDIEANALDKTLREMGIPSLKIVSDYSEEDEAQLRVRIEAFGEVVGQGTS